VGDVELCSSRKRKWRRFVIKSESGILGNRSGSLEIDQNVKRSLETTCAREDGEIVKTRCGETIGDLPEAFRSSTKSRSADLGNLASRVGNRRLLICRENLERTILNVCDLDNDLISLIIVLLIDVDGIVDVTLVGDELRGLCVFLKATTDDVGLNKVRCDVAELDGVSNGRLVKRRIGCDVLETDNGKVIRSIGKLARRNGDLAPCAAEIVFKGGIRRSASLDVIVARTVSGKVVKVVVNLNVSVLDVVHEDGDVISNL